MHSGVANLPLHPGKAPRWLFQRMESLAGSISEAMVLELGRAEFLRRMSDPFWFQAISCVLGFDWHSSGTTTVTGGAFKQALRKKDLGIYVAGGKGRASNATLLEIEDGSMRLGLSSADMDGLTYSSRMTAKVDSCAIQDGHSLYYHALMFSEDGEWTVIQQGLDPKAQMARRYHWHKGDFKAFVESPHTAIVGHARPTPVLDMTAPVSECSRKCVTDLVNDLPVIERDLDKAISLFKAQPRVKAGAANSRQSSLDQYDAQAGPGLDLTRLLDGSEVLNMPRTIDWAALKKAYDVKPHGFEEVLAVKGIGPATVRALSLVSDLIYGSKASWKDPVRYSFAVGGKDGVPYPVDRRTYDRTIEVLGSAVDNAKLGDREKLEAISRLRRFAPEGP